MKTNRESDDVHEPATADDDALRQRFPKPTLPAAIYQALTIVGMNAYLLYLVVAHQSSPVAIALFAVLELISMSLIMNLALIGVPQPLRVGNPDMPIPKRLFAIAFVSAGLLGIAWFGVINDRERIVELIRQRDPIAALRELHILWPLLASAALSASVALGDRQRWSRTGGSFVNGTAMQAAPKFITETANTAIAFVRDALALWERAKAFKTEVEKKISAATGEAKARLDALNARFDAVIAAAERFKQLDLVVVSPGGKSVADQLDDLKQALLGLDLAVRSVPELPEPAKRTIASAIGKVLGVLAATDALNKLRDLLELAKQGKELAENLTVRLEWSAPLQKYPLSSSNPVFIPSLTKPLKLSGEIRAKATHGRPAGIDLTCSLESFSIDLVGSPSFMVLSFDHILFKIESDKKPEIDVKFGGMTFTGPLSFVESLRKVIPLDGFSDPPSLDVSPQGIEASFSLALPNVAIGVFSLANVSIGAGFKVPFIGDPLTVRFNFCTKEHPFLLTVSMLGGGGFFSIVLDPKGVHSLEAALEFGASLSIDFGVASGEITVMAGIYFKMLGDAVTLTGYLRMRGEVDVLGLISASIELRMELSYESKSGKVLGRASLEIEVEVLFFSTTVRISCERRFKGSSGDPSFRDVYGETYDPCPPPLNAPMPCVNAWDEYVYAFAD